VRIVYKTAKPLANFVENMAVAQIPTKNSHRNQMVTNIVIFCYVNSKFTMSSVGWLFK